MAVTSVAAAVTFAYYIFTPIAGSGSPGNEKGDFDFFFQNVPQVAPLNAAAVVSPFLGPTGGMRLRLAYRHSISR